jgi:hypothetical protein
MVQALPSITSCTLRCHQPPQLLTPEGKCYPNCKPLPIMKRNVLRKIKINGNCSSRNNKSYYTEPPYQTLYLQSRQLKLKPAVPQWYYCMREPNHHMQQLPSLSISREKANTEQVVINKRRVRFSKATDVYELPERTLDEKLRSWYSKSDYGRFANERKNTVHVIQQLLLSYQLNSDIDIDEYLDPTEHTIIGVEQYIYGKEQIFRRKLHMLHHIRTVLQQQQQKQQQRQRRNMKRRMVQQQQEVSNQYFYPESYSDVASNYQCNGYQHPSIPHESYLRYASHLCATTIQCPTMSSNPLQHVLHVL